MGLASDAPPRRAPRLFAEYPELAGVVPWMPLAVAPTPVERCAAIAPYLGRDDVWIKRDDIASPRYGGNKIRRFEYLFADARARGATRLVTAGGLASTQVTATVILGKASGFEVVAALFDQPVTSFARAALLTGAAAGGTLVYGGGYADTAWRALAALIDRPDSYLILPGASTPMCNLGYVDAMFELADQVDRGELPRPDRIVLPSGSGGTVAGLALGAAILGWPTAVIGVRITDLIASNRFTIRMLIDATARYLAKRAPGFPKHAAPRARFGIDHREIGGGYGVPTARAIEAMSEVTRLIGAPGETTYSGKAMAALRRIAREHPKENILYWQTLSSVGRDPPSIGPSSLPPELRRFFDGDVEV